MATSVNIRFYINSRARALWAGPVPLRHSGGHWHRLNLFHCGRSQLRSDTARRTLVHRTAAGGTRAAGKRGTNLLLVGVHGCRGPGVRATPSLTTPFFRFPHTHTPSVLFKPLLLDQSASVSIRWYLPINPHLSLSRSVWIFRGFYLKRLCLLFGI